jgi:hypothetical protein
MNPDKPIDFGQDYGKGFSNGGTGSSFELPQMPDGFGPKVGGLSKPFQFPTTDKLVQRNLEDLIDFLGTLKNPVSVDSMIINIKIDGIVYTFEQRKPPKINDKKSFDDNWSPK